MKRIVYDDSNQAGATASGCGFFGLLFLVFLILKLLDKITWSWWWVTAPLWGPAVLVCAGVLIFFICAFISVLIDNYKAKKKGKK